MTISLTRTLVRSRCAKAARRVPLTTLRLTGDYYPRDSKSTSAYARSIQRTKAQKRRAFLKWGTVGLVAVLFVLGVVGIFSPDTEATSLTSSSHAASAQGQELLADTDDYVSPPSNDIVDLSSFEPIEEDPTASPIESTQCVQAVLPIGIIC